ncbi:IQ motif [Macleaya cordata]|uniref:IQ motif n=1 Tax=Macleaya cordata TaxID=56857 RepID=A0A200QHU9_MACCD|nr:IQ motif [Macleaya cordata]
MGLTGELVRSVFSKNRSVGSSHDSNVRNYGVDRRKWSSVRSYLCGDEFNSVLAEEDSASIRSSEATVTQPITEELNYEVETQSEEKQQIITEEKQNSPTISLNEENAAIVIQSAFRRFLAKRRNGGIKEVGEMDNVYQGLESPSRQSMATSIEAQTGGSVEALKIREENVAFQHRIQQKSRTNILKLKEDWDDSTVSSNISKLRIQNRLEATTRRERALAYAFSQQLRICSKKKSSRSDTMETNMGWSWLERWMATRLPEGSSVEDRVSSRLEPISSDRRPIVIKRNFDVAGEEKESCGSNEVSVGIDSLTETTPYVNDSSKPIKKRLKATKTGSRRKTVTNHHYPTQLSKVSKKECLKEAEKDKKHKQTQQGSATKEVQCKDASPQLSSVSVTNNSST